MGILLYAFPLSSQPSEYDKGIKKATRLIEKLVKKKKVPGLAIAVSKNGETIWETGFGYADIENKEPVQPGKTIFRIASVSKPLAATALAKMVEEKKITLDSSFYKYVPYFPKKKHDFTIRQLGSHTAGIRTYKGNEFLNNKPLTIKEGIAMFQDDPLLFEPGTSYAYNSYDWTLISLAMQEASGMPFEEYVEENVLKPLGMEHTFPEGNSPILNKAVFYSKKGKRKFRLATQVDNFYKLAGGGYLSTATDILKLGNAYLKGDFIPSTITHQFLSSQELGEQLTYYGIGWEVSYDHKKRPYYGHIGNGVGGYAVFRIYPAQNMVVSILINVTNPQIEKKTDKIIDAVMKRAMLYQ